MSIWLGNQRLDSGDSANGKSGYNIGDIFYTTRMDTALNGAVECNGGTYSTADYTGAGSIGELLRTGKIPYISLADYENHLRDHNGICGHFGWDGETTTAFRVPLLKDVFIESALLSDGHHSGRVYAGLPDHNHIYTEAYQSGGNSGGSRPGTAAYRTSYTQSASQSNPIYGNSDTVQPEAVKYRAMVQLFNATTDEAVAIVGTVVAQVTRNTSQISDLRNMYNITETGKETIVNWCMPDYTAAVSMSSGAAAPTDGWAIAHGANATVTYAVNGVSVAQGNWRSGQWTGDWNLQIMVSTGDIVTGGDWKFIPCKGVNQ